MSLQVEALFTASLGLQALWQVIKVELNTDKRRIDFEVGHTGQRRHLQCWAEQIQTFDRAPLGWRSLEGKARRQRKHPANPSSPDLLAR